MSFLLSFYFWVKRLFQGLLLLTSSSSLPIACDYLVNSCQIDTITHKKRKEKAVEYIHNQGEQKSKNIFFNRARNFSCVIFFVFFLFFAFSVTSFVLCFELFSFFFNLSHFVSIRVSRKAKKMN